MKASDPNSDLPTFTSADLIKVIAATYLPLCEQLARAGALDKTRLAKTIAACAPPDAEGAWVNMLDALCIALERPAPPAAARKGADTAIRDWRIVEGGMIGGDGREGLDES